MADLYSTQRELGTRTKLVIGLAGLGIFAGGLLRAAYLAEWPADWTLPIWGRWIHWLLTNGHADDLALFAGIGAAALALPALWLLIRPRSSRKPNF